MSESEQDDGGQRSAGESIWGEDQVTNVLLYRAQRSPDIEAFENDATSPAAQVARGRGPITDKMSDPLTEHTVDHSGREGRVYELSLQDGRLSLNNDYMMRFVPEPLVEADLTVFDVLSVPDLPSYPLTKTAYAALPYAVQAILEDRGYAKIQGVYDTDSQQFFGTERGWNNEERELDVAERIQEVTAKVGSYVKAADYVFVREADGKWTTEILAKNRGISEKAVESNVREVDEILNG
jgi:hypothetical protein